MSDIWSPLNSVVSKTAFYKKTKQKTKNANSSFFVGWCLFLGSLYIWSSHRGFVLVNRGFVLQKPSQTLRWLGVNMSVLRQQTWGATEYWMGGPSLSLTDTPSGSLWKTSLEFHPSGRAAITASNRASVGLPHLALPVIKTHLLTMLKHTFTSSPCRPSWP